MRGLVAACTVMAAVVVPSNWDLIGPDERIEQLEARVERLERVWREHDKTYHFICEFEDCLTTNESLRIPGAKPERQRWLDEAFPYNLPDHCRGMCGGEAWWNGSECLCPKEK